MADNVDVEDFDGARATVRTVDIAGKEYQVVILADALGNLLSSFVVSGPLTDAQLRASAVPISAASLPLPAGAATSSAQSSMISSLGSIDTKTPALGQSTMAGSMPVCIASNQGAVPISAASLPLPTGAATEATLVAMSGQLNQPAGYAPFYDGPVPDGSSFAFDPSGQLASRSAVFTDEGTFRVNFANTSLAVAIGSPTRSGLLISGYTAGVDVHAGDYFKYDADPETSWTQIEGYDSAGNIVLASTYPSATASGAASRALVDPFTGSGGSMSVASGQLTLTSGTTSLSVTGVERNIDYGPLVFRARHSLSQRIANQDCIAGIWDPASRTAPKWFARFRFTGTTNTSVICETGRNPTGAPSASETESTAVSCLATTNLQEFRVELLTESVRFYIGNNIVAEHTRAIPAQHDEMMCGIFWNNTGAPATTSNVVVDYITCKNHNKLEIGVMSDAEMIGVRPSPMRPIEYSVAGVIAINTDLMVIDCLQAGSVMIHCRSMGTTGVVTPAWSSEPTFANAQTATITTPAGADATTFNAAGMWRTPVFARYLRLRLTTATTAGTTTIGVSLGSLEPTSRLATQPVSGTVTANLGTGGTGATSIGKAEDAAAASGDTGVAVWGVRRDALTTSSSAAADYNELAVNRFGALYNVDFRVMARSFKSVSAAFTPAGSATDIWDLFGNVTTTVVVTRLRVWATQTTGGVVNLTARVRSTANSAGTRVAGTAVRLEQADTAASSTPGHYTANPTTGTDVGALDGGFSFVGATTAQPGYWDFVCGERGKGLTLSGTAQGLVVNLNGVTVTGGSFVVACEWYEF